MAEALVLGGGDLAVWGGEMKRYPQILLNVKIKSRPDLASHPTLGPLIAAVTEDLGARGRVLVRYSGTENLARVMIEGEDEQEIGGAAKRIARSLEESLGSA
jgi:phosphoglucosamine mutase